MENKKIQLALEKLNETKSDGEYFELLLDLMVTAKQMANELSKHLEYKSQSIRAYIDMKQCLDIFGLSLINKINEQHKK